MTSGDSCKLRNYTPNGRILRTHHYYDKRPYATYMYGEFDKLNWAAYVGISNETVGTALAGEALRTQIDPLIKYSMLQMLGRHLPSDRVPGRTAGLYERGSLHWYFAHIRLCEA